MKFYYLTDAEINNLRTGLMSKKNRKNRKNKSHPFSETKSKKATYPNHFLPFISKQKKQKKVIISKKI